MRFDEQKTITTYHCDRCKDKIYQGESARHLRMNRWPVTFKNHLGHMQTFHIKIEGKEAGEREADHDFCLDCACLIIKTAIEEGEFNHDNT